MLSLDVIRITAMENILQRIWYSPDAPAAYSSIDRLHRAARKELPSISKDDVKEWLQSQDTYTLFQSRNQKIKRRKYFSPMPFVMLEADLLFMP